MFQLLPSFWQEMVMNFGIFALAALGLYVCFSAKQFSLGNAGLMATGAYTSAIISINADVPLIVDLLLASLAAAAMGLVIGSLLALRLNEFYLAIGTLAFNVALIVVLDNATQLGGPLGLFGVPISTTPEIAVGTLGVGLLVVWRLQHSRLGRAMRAIHVDEDMAASNGVSVWRTKLAAWGIAGALTGLAGGLWAHDLGVVRPDFFDYSLSTTLWVPVIVGGTTSVIGPILGGAIYVLLPYVVPQQVVADPLWILGSILIVVGIFRPTGLIGIREQQFVQRAVRALARWGTRIRPGATVSTANVADKT